jgi:hypothetical protein
LLGRNNEIINSLLGQVGRVDCLHLTQIAGIVKNIGEREEAGGRCVALALGKKGADRGALAAQCRRRAQAIEGETL